MRLTNYLAHKAISAAQQKLCKPQYRHRLQMCKVPGQLEAYLLSIPELRCLPRLQGLALQGYQAVPLQKAWVLLPPFQLFFVSWLRWGRMWMLVKVLSPSSSTRWCSSLSARIWKRSVCEAYGFAGVQSCSEIHFMKSSVSWASNCMQSDCR